MSTLKMAYGTLKEVIEVATSNGKAARVKVEAIGTYNKDEEAYNTEDIFVYYVYNESRAFVFDNAMASAKYIDNTVLLTYSEGENERKFGSKVPCIFGLASIPATYKTDVTEDMQMEAETALDEAILAGDLPDGYMCTWDDIASITDTAEILMTAETETAKNARTALMNLVNPATTYYIGYVGSAKTKQFESTSGTKTKFSVSVTLPQRPEESETKWAVCSFFGKMVEKAEKCLHKSDRVILKMTNPVEYEGVLLYTGMSFRKIPKLKLE